MAVAPEALIKAMAATRLAERLYDALRERDPEGLKRLIDRAMEEQEQALVANRPHPDAETFRRAAAAELTLLRALFARG
jgi:ketosteroid isomerase-like protein